MGRVGRMSLVGDFHIHFFYYQFHCLVLTLHSELCRSVGDFHIHFFNYQFHCLVLTLHSELCRSVSRSRSRSSDTIDNECLKPIALDWAQLGLAQMGLKPDRFQQRLKQPLAICTEP